MATKKTVKNTKKNYKNEYAKAKQHKKQMDAVIMFTVGILLFAIILIKGESVWQYLHSLLFGVFGVSAIILPISLIYISIIAALDKEEIEIKFKLLQTFGLVLISSSLFEVFSKNMYGGENFIAIVKNLYIAGQNFKGGGLYSVALGYPLYLACGKTATVIILFLLVFMFFMLLTGSTLIGFFKGFAKPVQKIEETYVKHQEKIQEKLEKEKKFNIDVDLGPEQPMPLHPVECPKPEVPVEQVKSKKQLKMEEKAKKAEQEIKQSGQQLDELIKRAVNEDILTPKEEKLQTKIIMKEESQNIAQQSQVVAPQEEYVFPKTTLLNPQIVSDNKDVSGELKANAALLVNTLSSFGVQTRVVDISRGPTVTRYELQPSAGVKISKITGLADDIALNLATAGVRIEAPIPNKAAVGIEVPNKKTEIVSMREMLESKEFIEAKSRLTMALGRDIAGNFIVSDISKMPHMLIAGATGSGKSVCINSIIISLLYKSSPNDVRFLMVDPKVVELGVYNGIPHLLVPVVTDPRKAAGALNWAVTEMLKRYKLFADNNVRDLKGYNELAKTKEDISAMPQIVLIIDELADLMMAAPNEVEDSICRLAQMARAAGMHLIIATQRPSVDVITGVIKANIPSRIAFSVSSQIDSRTIIDSAGAEKLLGRGDMLFAPVGEPKPIRVQGCFVSDKEVEKVVEFIKNKENAEYDDKIIEEIEKQAVKEKSSSGSDGGGFEENDELMPQAIECVIEAGQASTSYLQRKLKVGYARAARIIDQMEEMGVVGAFEGSKPRQILMTKQQWLEKRVNDDTNSNE